MPSRVAQSGLWTVSSPVGAADLNKDPGGWIEANTIGTLDTAGPGSGRLINGSFAQRAGRSYLVLVNLGSQYLFAGTAAAFVTNILYVNGVEVGRKGFRLANVGDVAWGATLMVKHDAAGTGTVTLILDQVVSAAATVRHEATGHYAVIDIGPTS